MQRGLAPDDLGDLLTSGFGCTLATYRSKIRPANSRSMVR